MIYIYVEDLTKVEPQKKELRTLQLSDGCKVEWSIASKSMDYYGNIHKKSIRLDSHDDYLVAVERIDADYFLSVSKDNVIKIWETNGELYATYDKHKNQLLGIHFLEENILSIGKNEPIRQWKKDGSDVNNIDVQIETLVNLRVNDELCIVITSEGLSYFDIETGKKLFQFSGLYNFLQDLKHLKSKKWLTLTQDKISIWNSEGKKIADIEIKFDFEELIETKEHLIVFDEVEHVCILDLEGKIISKYAPKDSLLAKLKRLIQAGAELQKLQETKNKIEQFPHRNNPMQNGTEVLEELESQKETIKRFNLPAFSDVSQYVWNFFNRPIFEDIFALLKTEEDGIQNNKGLLQKGEADFRQLIGPIEEQIPPLEKKKNIAFIAGGIALCVGLLFLKSFTPMALTVAIIGGFILTAAVKYNTTLKSLREELHEYQDAIKTITILLPEVDSLQSRIQAYRWSIFQQVPSFKDKSVYDAQKVESIMKELIYGQIKNEALSFCGICKEDIISHDKQPIVLHDWSLLQANYSGINKHNLNSFWLDGDKMIFATQYIQYIFLTEKKIEVFSTHYDFILNQFIRRESQTFYYKDVTNISKKEVDRKLLSKSKDESSSATEISLVVSSGDKIALTVFNNETFKMLNVPTKEKEDSSEKLLSDIEIQIKSLKEGDMNDETNEQIAYLEAQLEILSANPSFESITTNKIDTVDATVKNIRSQIHRYKE